MVTLLAEPGDRTRVSRGTPGGRPMLPVRQDPEWHLGPCPKPRSPPRDPGHERSLPETPSARPSRGVRRPVSCVLARCGRRRRRCWGGKPGRGGGFPRVLLHRSRGLVTHAQPDGRTRMVHVYILFFSVL